jgi:hypothetical protein
MTLSKLTISKVANKSAATLSASTSEADKFTCQFNPTSFDVKKVNAFQASPAGQGADLGKLHFTGGVSQDMTLTLTFDSTDTGQPVFNLYTKLRKFTLVDTTVTDSNTQLSEPPWVIVQWGSYIGFVAVVESLTEKYIYFKPDGTPLRAEVTVNLKQVSKDTSSGAQNPTSRSEPRRTWVVEEGQRLDWIAFQEYGDSNAWRHIAEANQIDNPHSLHSGQVLRLTPRPV